MGKCITCGRVTANCYPYYKADLVDSYTIYDINVKKTTYRYANFERIEEYLCTDCIVKSEGGVKSLIFRGFCFLIIAGGLIYFFLINGFQHQQSEIGFAIFISSLVCGFLGIGFIWSAIKTYFEKGKDINRSSESGGKSLIKIAVKEVKNSGKYFFTETEYRELR